VQQIADSTAACRLPQSRSHGLDRRIGEPLPAERLQRLWEPWSGGCSRRLGAPAAESMLTHRHLSQARHGAATIDGKAVTVTAIAKGSGNDRADMATDCSVRVFTTRTCPTVLLQES